MCDSYETVVGYIENVPKFTQKNRPEHTRELLRRLGDPQKCFRVIHVAGTNGKGSVCAFLERILRQAGYRTGLFTSPHLVRINERFQINRREVDDLQFTQAFHKVMEAASAMMKEGYPHPAYFELLFAMGMLLFRENKADLLVMETGLGGRLDATNTVEDPVCCVITSISRDHTKYLGDTIEEIAGEKAGIIKEGIPVVCDGSDELALNVIQRKAREMHAPCIPVFEENCRILRRDDKGIAFELNNRYYEDVCVEISFPADYQAMNCSLAMTAVRAAAESGRLGEKADRINVPMICDAVREVRWSGRMEEVLPGVVIDGAHNADGMKKFLQAVAQRPGKVRRCLLFAVVSDKDYQEMIREICAGSLFSCIVLTETGESRKVKAEDLAAVFRSRTDVPVYVRPDVKEAFSLALKEKGEGMLYCAGSLYLAGEIRAILARSEEGADLQ